MNDSLPSRLTLPELTQRIRERGAVLDMPFTQALYKPLLDAQSREGVHVRRDEAYGAHARHRLDVYLPEERRDNLPVLVFMHGGGFVRGDKRERENVGLHFARQGMMVVIPNYRLAPQARWPAGAEDVVAVYEWLRAHAAELGANPECIFLGGESAGAAHVAAATLIKRFHPTQGLHVRGVVLISGVYNAQLEWLARTQFKVLTPDPRNEPYFGSDFAQYSAMSTVALIDAAPMPIFMSYAELDLLQMQVQAGELFATLVVKHGFTPELQVTRGHNHLTQVYAINTGDDSLSQPMMEFMNRHQ